MAKWLDVMKNAVSIFRRKNKDQPNTTGGVGSGYYGGFSATRPYTTLLKNATNDILSTIYSRIAVNAADFEFKQFEVKKDGTQEPVHSPLLYCLTQNANLDQSGYALMIDLVKTMLTLGIAALVPVEYELKKNGKIEIFELRVGRVVEFFPQQVRVNVYNPKTGVREDVVLDKKMVCIIENPHIEMARTENYLLKQLVRKLQLSEKEDMANLYNRFQGFIQFPFSSKSETMKQRYDQRMIEIEEELANSKYGIARLDINEKFQQINRELKSPLHDDIQTYTTSLYQMFGLSQGILNGTATGAEQQNYLRNIVEPIIKAIVAEIDRKWISNKEYEKGMQIHYYVDPFQFIDVASIASAADTLARNAIVTPNEIRERIGLSPVADMDANSLYNRNMPLDEQLGGMEDQSTLEEEETNGV